MNGKRLHNVGTLGPGVHYLFECWSYGPSRGLGVIRGGKTFNRRDYADE